MKKHADSIDAAILARILSGKKDRVWAPADFLDLGPRAARFFLLLHSTHPLTQRLCARSCRAQ